MNTLGSFALYIALYVSLVGVALAFVAGRSDSRRFLHASRFATFTAFGAVTIAGCVLLHAFLTHDFSLEYVVQNSSQSMPFFYLLSAFWGGQAGSLLFWVIIVGAFSSLCLWVYRDSYQEFMPWVTMVCLAVMSGLLIILVFGSNPFETYEVIKAPADGEGLNPLLRTPKMVLHPPALLTGLASMTVPFAFAIAALINKTTSAKWVEAARAWILVPWLFLSVGNILGGMWAYEELGWGGYWAWDPVENAAFMPWLMATALIHSLMIQERRGMFKRWNIGLMIGTFLLTVFGTYITRSGLIESVHTFAQSDIGDYFLIFLIALTVTSVGLFAYRWKDLKSSRKLTSVASREASFMLNNWLFLAMTVVVFFGTLWPKIKEGLTGQDVSIGPPWFNRWMIPLGIIMLIMMGVGTVIAWRRATWKNFRRDFLGPLVGTAVLAPALIFGYWFLRGQDLGVVPSDLEIFYAVATVSGCIFVTGTIVQEFYRGIRARMRGHDEDPLTALFTLYRKQRRRYGGYVVHFGVVLAFVAFAGNALKLERDVALERGESVEIGDYTVTYEGLSEDNSNAGVQLILADTAIERGGKSQKPMQPGKARFGDHEMMTSEIDIRSTPLEDLYLAFVSADQNGQSATFKIFVGPFTWWFWVACVFIVLGTFICLWPTRDAMAALGKSPLGFGRSVAALSLVAVTFSPLIVWHVESHTDWGSAARWEKAALEDAEVDDADQAANADHSSSNAAVIAAKGGER